MSENKVTLTNKPDAVLPSTEEWLAMTDIERKQNTIDRSVSYGIFGEIIKAGIRGELTKEMLDINGVGHIGIKEIGSLEHLCFLVNCLVRECGSYKELSEMYKAKVEEQE